MTFYYQGNFIIKELPYFIIKEIATAYDGRVKLLPLTKEKYISFTKNVQSTADNGKNSVKLRFIDSYKFLSMSLDKLASFLSKDKLKIVHFEFSKLSTEEFDLLTRKGVFPYEYIDCMDKLQNTCLSPRESFYSSLTLYPATLYPRATTRTPRTFDSGSPLKPWANTAIYILKRMFCY